MKLEVDVAQNPDLSRNATVINTSEADKLYTVANLPKFKDSKIPK